ncbi:hypothetical protein ACGFW5_06000 [Streptomyces sp. NPDC048416]|uniref:hypothetical protein n=1 Tax=Streptomyces sp. NPDC048416 TaxID=3365546 RepID=UPI0037173C9A
MGVIDEADAGADAGPTAVLPPPGGPFGTPSIEGMPHHWYGRNEVGAHAWVPYAGQSVRPVGERAHTDRGRRAVAVVTAAPTAPA